MNDKCYICSEAGILVRPCKNERCTARVHENCLAKQYEFNNKCYCQSDIVKTTTTNFNIENCMKTYIIRLIFIILYPLTIFFLTMSNTLILVCKSKSDTQCDKGMLQGQLFYYIVFPVLIISLIFSYYCTILGEKIDSLHYIQKFQEFSLNKKIILSGIFYLMLVALIMIAHCIGYPIINWYFDGNDELFTWRTASAGYIIYCLIGIIVLLFYCLANCCQYLYQLTIDQFFESTIKFGTIVDSNGL